MAQAHLGATAPWVWVNLEDRYISWEVVSGHFEPNETAFTRRLLRPGSVVFDVGANLGYYTMFAATLVGAEGHAYSFEPLSYLYDSLQRSVTRNGFADRVTAFNVAVGDRKGEAHLQYLPHAENWGGSFLLFGDALPGHATEIVPIEPITALVETDRLDLIKIDVEGAEFMALSACADMLTRLRPTILSEIHPGQLARVSGRTPDEYLLLMHDMGYRCCALAPGGEIGPEVGIGDANNLMNVVFVPEAR